MCELKRMYINGNWVDALDGDTIESVNPYSGETWATIPRGKCEDVGLSVGAASKAFQSAWQPLTGFERADWLYRIADAVGEDKERLAYIESLDNGKPIRETTKQVASVESAFRYFAGIADKIVGEVLPMHSTGMFDFTERIPFGVVAAITAWNSPLSFFAQKVPAILAAGNTVVVKPSEIASVSTLEVMSLIADTGLPAGVINIVTGYGQEAGAALVGHSDVRKVSLTGGSVSGRAAGKVMSDGIRPGIFELGGKSANIIFEDANVDEAVKGALAGIFAAGGQTCVAGSRLLVHDKIYDEVVEKVSEGARRIVLGNPLLADTQMGPMATVDQVARMREYVSIGKSEGAKLVEGGTEVPETTGFFFSPTIFVDVTNDMRVAREEIFGPLLCVLRFSNENEAIEIANDSEYGLAAGVWTRDMTRAFGVARQLEVGTVWVNNYRVTSYAIPFGGMKGSGYGRERGLESIREYTTIRNTIIDVGAGIGDPFAVRT